MMYAKLRRVRFHVGYIHTNVDYALKVGDEYHVSRHLYGILKEAEEMGCFDAALKSLPVRELSGEWLVWLTQVTVPGA